MQEYLLFALAVLGHACLLTWLLNVVYSQPYHRLFLKIARAAIGLLIPGGPIAFVVYFGFSVSPVLQLPAEHFALAIYLTLTLSIAGIGFPLTTLRRLLRRPPNFIHEASFVLDVVKELGQAPVGAGESAHAARLPFNGIFQVEFTTLTIELANLPKAWDGLTLLQLSDLHFFGTPSRDFYECIVRRCLAEGVPDLLLITGDIIDEDKFIAWIEPVLGSLRWNVGAFAILGNHDWWHDFAGVRRQLQALGIHTVSNKWEQLEIRGHTMTVIGHEGPWFRPGPDLSSCPAGEFRLLLSHTPDNIGWAKRNLVALMLSGHNHGGQIRVPLFGSIFVPSKYSRRYDMGTFFEPPTVLHVNRGLSGKEPIRFRCRPQVTRIVLKCSLRGA